jgi:tRNA modification GTPase
VDLVPKGNESHWEQPSIAVSAETGVGLQSLLEAINEVLRKEHGEITPDVPLLTRARHKRALSIACSELEQFRRAWREDNLPATIASVHLRTAVLALEELIGTVEIEDVFDRVFSSFCVGK